MNMTVGATFGPSPYYQPWQNTACAPTTTCAPMLCCCGHHHACYHPVRVTAVCTCPPMWGSVNPPPWCPVHGQALSARVVC